MCELLLQMLVSPRRPYSLKGRTQAPMRHVIKLFNDHIAFRSEVHVLRSPLESLQSAQTQSYGCLVYNYRVGIDGCLHTSVGSRGELVRPSVSCSGGAAPESYHTDTGAEQT